MARVVVVGAGIAGLAAAYALRDHDVVVIDGADVVGGKLRTSTIAGIDVDEGAEMFLARVPDGLALARAVGLGDELVNPATSSASVWSRGALRQLPARTVYGVPAHVRSLLDVLGPAATARAAADLVAPGHPVADDVSVGSVVRRRMGSAVVDGLVDPLLGGVYAGRADELSLHATAPQLVTPHGSLARAVARATSAAPAGPVFATVRGGLGELARSVAIASGATVVTGRLVRRIERTEDGRFRVVHGPTTDEQSVSADAVVVAVPPAPAARLLADLAPVASAELGAIDTASMAIVTTAWRAADLPDVRGSGYLVPATAGREVKAVTFASAKWPHLRAADIRVVRCSLGRHGDTAVLQRDDDDLVAAAVTELRLTTGTSARPVESRVTRWGGALPQYAVGHVDRVRRIRAAVDAVPGLAVCGAAYDGVGIPACIRSAERAVAQLRPLLSSR